MAVNYLQYISSVHQTDQTHPNIHFLVSGVDTQVRRIIGQNIITSCYAQGKTLFMIDNTQSAVDGRGTIGPYRIADALSGEVCLCRDLFEVNSLNSISRLRSLLFSLGFDGTRVQRLMTCLSFVLETERRLGNSSPLTADVLEEYGATILVKRKLNQLVERGKLGPENYEYLVGKYAEVSASAADFEMFLMLFAPFLSGASPSGETAVRLPAGEFLADRPMQELMCQLMLCYVRQNQTRSAVLILDDGRGDRGFLMDVLKALPAAGDVHMLSRDAFSLGESDLSVLMNTFSARVYTRHEDMTSSGRIETHCGQIDVVKRASTVTVDRHLRANSIWDTLFGTDRTETEIQNAPVKEYRFRKELIHSLPTGTGIIDCGGNQVLFSF